MNYQVVFTNSAKKDLKKIDRTALVKIKQIIDIELSSNVQGGKALTGNTAILMWKTRISKVDFRIAYTIKKDVNEIVILMVGTRENYYKELEKRL